MAEIFECAFGGGYFSAPRLRRGADARAGLRALRELADGERIVAGLGQPLARALGVRMNADYRLRRFTPRAELAFAGHPTTGSAHAVLEAGIAQPRDGRLRQECGAGILEPSVEGELRVS